MPILRSKTLLLPVLVPCKQGFGRESRTLWMERARKWHQPRPSPWSRTQWRSAKPVTTLTPAGPIWPASLAYTAAGIFAAASAGTNLISDLLT